jgi:cytochrome c oxidase subunit 4
MGATVEDIQKHKKTYIGVFVALAVLTIVTVLVSRFEFGIAMGVFIALVIATTKGTLVGGFFMHLFSEKKIVYWLLVLCVVFFVALMALPSVTSSHGNYREGWWGPPATGKVAVEDHDSHSYDGDGDHGESNNDHEGHDY